MDTKKCPMCAEQIPLDARVCEFCGTKFEEEQPASTVQAVRVSAPMPPPQPIAPPALAPRKGSPWTWIAAGLGLFLVIALVGGGILIAPNFGGGQTSPLVGEWTSKDSEGRDIHLSITMDNSGTHQVVWIDEWAVYCEPQTYLATGKPDAADPNFMQVRWVIDCPSSGYHETGISKYHYVKGSDTIEEEYAVYPDTWNFTWHRVK